jgi:hypothetical protein
VYPTYRVVLAWLRDLEMRVFSTVTFGQPRDLTGARYNGAYAAGGGEIVQKQALNASIYTSSIVAAADMSHI